MNQLILIGSLYLILGLFEIKFPAQKGQKISGRVRNIFLTAILLVSGVLFVTFFYVLIPIEMRFLGERGIAFSILYVLAFVFLFDLIFYWYHRAEHRFNFFWAVHELHHSDTELNASTSMRTYWLERPLQALLITLPIQYIIGIDERGVIILPFVMITWLFFAHANWRLRLGFLTPIICGPQVHRIHHSILPQHQDKNMAQFFPVIDIIFGTYYKPGRDEFPPTGTINLPSSAPISEIMIRPFKMWFGAKK